MYFWFIKLKRHALQTIPYVPSALCRQRAPPGWSLKRAVHTTTECSTTGSCWTRCRWTPTPTAASSTPRSRWTPTYLRTLPHAYSVRSAFVQTPHGTIHVCQVLDKTTRYRGNKHVLSRPGLIRVLASIPKDKTCAKISWRKLLLTISLCAHVVCSSSAHSKF